ncbi:MAG TPA: DNA-3-methyladenine glycosylase [Steroidobacteraceae bacterium]|nr:DNA-3-methyladenine glycosylase [Steroidobacteraceae bacterium]
MTDALRHLRRDDPVMAQLIRRAGPFTPRPERGRSPYEALLRAVAHQQLTGKAANTILGRFCALYGGDSYPHPDQLVATPDDQLRDVGFSRAKAASLKDIAAKTLDGTIPERRVLARLSDEAIIERLTEARGVGRWTVEMLLMFTLGRPDVLPVDDYGIQNGYRLAYGKRRLPKPRVLATFGERWAPYRTTAAWYLWRAVDFNRERRPLAAQKD